MKYRIALLLALTSLSASAFAASPCQGKRTEYPTGDQLCRKKHHNQHRIDGLNRALQEVRANCSDSKVRG